jgi:DMSO/TMAO reductase YedYZ molybdopterin-dependent catalytic subunit
MSPRLIDWSLALAVALAFASGLLSLVSGRPEQWWVFALHGIAGLWLLPLTVWKLVRVWPRLFRPGAWDRRTLLGATALLVTALALGTGVWWTSGGVLVIAGYNLLNWHIIFGLLLTLAVSAHMVARARPLALRHLRGRRQALRWGGMLLGALAVWPAQQAVTRALNTPGGRRRFTGSRELGSYQGNGAFPVVSWVADRPAPLDLATWRVWVGGAVAAPFAVTLADIASRYAVEEEDAQLDCTGGFYTAQRWRGVRVAQLLDAAVARPEGRFVRFVSVTGYRWSLPLAEARAALLATHIGDEPLSHGHGAPLRLVAPGRRGFEWVKWLERVEVLVEPDPAQLLSIYTSGFTSQQRM